MLAQKLNKLSKMYCDGDAAHSHSNRRASRNPQQYIQKSASYKIYSSEASDRL